MVLDKIKKMFSEQKKDNLMSDDFLEINLEKEKPEKKILLRLFVLKEYEDVKEVLNYLREHYSIALIDIKRIKQKDPIELKRAVSKIKKTIDALNGSIIGHDNLIIAAPSFVEISKQAPKEKPEKGEEEF